jgi:thiol-disulfide isomerase/thioredoxin
MTMKRCLAMLALIPLCVAQAQQLPRKAPEYTINRIGDKPLLLSQYKGKPVVLAFILTYCSHCQRTVGFLSKDQDEYGPRGLQVLACAIENGSQIAVPGFVRNFKPTFPVGYSEGPTALAFLQHPMVKVPIMPLLAFIDRQGMIRAQFEGDDEKFFGEQHDQNLRAQIEALFKIGAPRKAPGAPKK